MRWPADGRAHYQPVISDLDLSEPARDRPWRWLLPAVTALCLVAFMSVNAFVARDTPRPAPAAPVPTSLRAITAAETWQQTRDLALARPVVAVPPTWQVREAQLERASVSSLLALPAAAYRTVTRQVSSVTTGLYPAEEEALLLLRYRLTDDRSVVLVRLPPSDPLRGVEPARYTADSAVVRGIDARILSGRSAVEPTIVLWTEGGRAYQLYSTVLSGPELIQLAELLR